MALQQKAIVIESRGDARLVSDSPIPRLRDDYILVKNVAVAINPTDWQHIDGGGQPGAIVGCDYAGTVMELGPNVTDRSPRVIESAASSMEVMATTTRVAPSLIGQALYQSLKLPLPTQPAELSSPTAHLRRQHSHWYSRHPIRKAASFPASHPRENKSRSTNRKNPSSNATVITTCSSRNFPLVKNLGADEAFDYKDPACCSKIRKYTADKLKHALDTISIDTSAKTCADALSTTGGVYRALEPIDSPRKDIDSHSTLAYSATGEALTDYGRSACKEDFEFGVMFWELAGNLLEQGKLKVHPLSVRSGGLKGVLEGLQEMREGILLETA